MANLEVRKNYEDRKDYDKFKLCIYRFDSCGGDRAEHDFVCWLTEDQANKLVDSGLVDFDPDDFGGHKEETLEDTIRRVIREEMKKNV